MVEDALNNNQEDLPEDKQTPEREKIQPQNEKWTRAHKLAFIGPFIALIGIILTAYYFKANRSQRERENVATLELKNVIIATLVPFEKLRIAYTIENNGANQVKITRADLGWTVATNDIDSPWVNYNNRKLSQGFPMYVASGKTRNLMLEGDIIDYGIRNSVRAGTMTVYIFGDFYYKDLVTEVHQMHSFVIKVNPDGTFKPILADDTIVEN